MQSDVFFFSGCCLSKCREEGLSVSISKVRITAIEAITSQPMQLYSKHINKNMHTPGGFKGSKAEGQKDSGGSEKPRKKAKGLE